MKICNVKSIITNKFKDAVKNNFITGKLYRLHKSIKTRRDINSEKYKMTNILLTLLFPIFIVCMAELNQNKYPSKFILFVAERPNVMLFNVIVAFMIFAALYFILRRGWRAVFVQSALYMTLSTTELFKYNTNGNHLTMQDLSLAKSLQSITSFAYIKITAVLIIYILICLIYIGAVFWFNPKIKMRWFKAIVPAVCCAGACASIMVVPSFGNKVYALFDIDTSSAKNTFILNEKFNNNGFLAFFMQDSTETIENELKVPENYNKTSIDNYLDESDEETTEKEYTDNEVQPNVVIIMSESYADFRVFDELGVSDDYYKGFDAVCNDKGAYSGYAIVPTYASYTVRTEFELMMGLPVKSMNDADMPQKLLFDRKQTTIPSYYKAAGYNTAYVHPYLSTFYGRDHIYSNYSFDKMIFEDDFTVNENYYGNYIDDATVYNQIEDLMKDSDKPMYIHATTMQNHQPYDQGAHPDDQFANYLDQIKHTGECLENLMNELKDFDEPTIVFYIGDHFPSLRGDDSVYTELGITSENCSTLYEQHYVIWSNFDADYSNIPNEKFSTFYMPYELMQIAGIKGDNFTSEMLDKIKTRPVYSTNYQPDSLPDDELDMLTYDRTLGSQLSDNPLSVLYPDETNTTEK